MRATDQVDEPPSFSIETERRTDYSAGSREPQKSAKQASGQFFSPFLVLSIGFGLIAAVVMFWLWTEQQFRQPIADDMVPYYPSSTETTAAQRLQQDRQFEPTVEIKPELPAATAAASPATTQSSTVRTDAAGQGMPQMAMERTTDAASMTVQQEVVKDENGLPQKQIVSTMTIESEPMREQPVIPALPAAGEEAVVTEPEAETTSQPQAAEVVTEQNDLVAEMAADAAEISAEPAAKTVASDGSAPYDAAVLLSMLPDTVAIQLGVFSQEAAAKKFLQQYSSLNLQLYKRQQQGKTQFVVVSASYVNGEIGRAHV